MPAADPFDELIPDPEDSFPGSDTESGEEVSNPLTMNLPCLLVRRDMVGESTLPQFPTLVSERTHCGGSGDTTHPSGTPRSPKGSTNVGREEPRPSLGVELELSANLPAAVLSGPNAQGCPPWPRIS